MPQAYGVGAYRAMGNFMRVATGVHREEAVPAPPCNSRARRRGADRSETYADAMRPRPCSRVGCSRRAAYTLTFDYDDRMVAIGPLAYQAEPHSYDLCEHHARSTTPPVGWTLVRPTPMRDASIEPRRERAS